MPHASRHGVRGRGAGWARVFVVGVAAVALLGCSGKRAADPHGVEGAATGTKAAATRPAKPEVAPVKGSRKAVSGAASGPFVRLEVVHQQGDSRWINGVVRTDGHILTCLSAFDRAAEVRVHAGGGRVLQSPGLAGYHQGGNVALLAVTWDGPRPDGLDVAAGMPDPSAALECVVPAESKAGLARGRVNASEAPASQPTYHAVWSGDAVAASAGGAIVDAEGRLAGLISGASFAIGVSAGPVPVVAKANLTGVRPELLGRLAAGEVITFEEWRMKRRAEVRRADATARRALGALHREDLNQARTAAEESLRLDARCGLAWQVIGSMHQAADESEQAIAAFQRAAELDATDAYPRYCLAVVLADAGKPEEALGAADAAVALAPRDSSAHSARGYVLQVAERYSEAVEAYRTAVELDPDDEYAAAEVERLEALIASGETIPLEDPAPPDSRS